ncbi:hypothetical protein [Pseudalkalibacillus salsuginis]|uniref:hypothetical protein n=1 Tax=Pseudalkalibacillus salsuginis TaxID=2910972 RepID=UPI001F17F22F|nr:hypothetical protein [Pseudalkalibacillus salsuginis]MCF6410362.1 hypothetical protein [Pseudalkalibacillus salsuginis]
MKRKNNRLIEIEHPHIREVEEHTVHPGVDEERTGDLLQNTADVEDDQAGLAQG